ncbi:hypothetical protein ACWIGI_28620 [Nocardia sp. NPDC055321]
MSWLLALGISPLALIGTAFGARQLFLKHLETARDGWRIQVVPVDGPADGREHLRVLIRPMGPVAVYEVKARVWSFDNVVVEDLPEAAKMTCDSEPLVVVINYPDPRFVFNREDQVAAPRPFVGVVWTDAVRLRPREMAIRQNVVDEELQRWVWHRSRNWFWFLREPEGHWRTIRVKWKCNRFNVPIV